MRRASSEEIRWIACARWLLLNESAFDGMGLPGEHFDFVRTNMQEEGGIPALAITNHGNCNSYAHAYLYSKELNKAGKTFKFIPGCEVYMHPDLDVWRDDYKRFKEKGEVEKLAKKNTKKIKDITETIDDAMFEAQTGAKLEKADDETSSGVENEEETKSNRFRDPVKRRHHLVVLAKHSKGLEHLFHTVSRGFMEGYYYYPRVDLKMLKQYQGDFVVSSACVTGDAEVMTSKGKIRLDELVSSVNAGEQVFILSFDETKNNVRMRPVIAGQLTKKNARVVEISLVGGKKVRLTPDHRVLTDKGWMRADELKTHAGIKILTKK